MIDMSRFEAIQNRMVNETLQLYESFVDPAERFTDNPGGERWSSVGPMGITTATGFSYESELAKARNTGRWLAFENEYAINGMENRISYVVGTGHTYTVMPRGDMDVGEDLIARAQDAIDRFMDVNGWWVRQVETLRRFDRDGEAFLRFFQSPSGLRVRFIEPDKVYQPQVHVTDPNWSWGIQTDPQDVETRIAYWVDNAEVDADEIQHRRANVDANVKRGIPLFWSVWRTLAEIEQLQRNMDRVAGIQTAIAMIRKHQAASEATVTSLRDKLAKFQVKDEDTGDVKRSYQEYPPGSIIDAPATTEYEFPTSGIDASRFVAIKESALRQVASRLVMPEFMLTSNAANSNFASTMVAEGPAVKYFERLQAQQREYDIDVMWRVLANEGLESAESVLHIEVGMPRVKTRDELQEANSNRIYLDAKVKSKQTVAGELGLDYRQEQQNIADDRDEFSDPFPALQGFAGGQNAEDKDADGKESVLPPDDQA